MTAASPRLHHETDAVRVLLIGAPVHSVSLSDDGDRLLVAADDHSVQCLDLTTGQSLWLLGEATGCAYVALSASGDFAVGGGPSGILRIWDGPTGRLLVQTPLYVGDGPLPNPIHAVAVSRSGFRVAAGTSRGLIVADSRTGHPLMLARGMRNGEVFCVCFTAADQHVAGGGREGTALIWTLESGRLVHELRHPAPLTSLASEGDAFVTGCADASTRVWDLQTGEPRHRLNGHLGVVTAVAISTGGRWGASGSRDGTLRVWSPATGVTEHVSRGHCGAVTAVCCVEDGTSALIASGSEDGTVRLQRLSPDVSLKRQCALWLMPTNTSPPI